MIELSKEQCEKNQLEDNPASSMFGCRQEQIKFVVGSDLEIHKQEQSGQCAK